MNMLHPSNHRRVLVIDDNERIHEDIRKILCPQQESSSLDEAERALFGDDAVEAKSFEPFDVDFANCGEDGFALVQKSLDDEGPYALAIIDMRMPPGWDGLETIKHIWAVENEIQIVICTAFTDRSWQDITSELEAADRLLILKKPFETIEVLQMASSLSEKWRLARRARSQIEELDGLVEQRTKELIRANESLKCEIAVRSDAENRLAYAANYDALTGLPNRANLLEKLNACLTRARRREGYQFAVMFLDLDNFKIINDSLGHDAGDDLLTQVAGRLTACVRSFDGICRDTEATARLGGDEFVIVLEELKNLSDAVIDAERIQAQISAPYEIKGHTVEISTSIGIAVNNEAVKEPGDLLRSADTAMYRAKQGGKACHAMFDQHMHDEVVARLTVENDLRKALDRDEFRILYQPIISLGTGRIAGFEALLRWHPTSKPMVYPDVFIPIAEELGLIKEMGTWIMKRACHQVQEWNQNLPKDRQVFAAVNVARQQLAVPDFPDIVQDVINKTHIDPKLLHLEITESTVIDAPKTVEKTLASLKEKGVQLYLDDFGTGYSSLSSLYDFPLDAVKIDRAFVYKSERHREYAAVISAVMMMARNLKMKVVAEGIETKSQLAQIVSFDCDFAQGYYFSKPFDADDAWAMLTSDELQKLYSKMEDLPCAIAANV